MNILIIHSSSYTQRMLQYFLSHYSPNIQTCTLELEPPPSKTSSLDLIFLNYDVSHQKESLSVLKKIQSLAPVVLIHSEPVSSLDKAIQNRCKGLLKKPVEPQVLQKIVNQLLPHTKDLKLTSYLKFMKPTKDSSLEQSQEIPIDHLEVKEPLPISGALDDDLHTLLTDDKNITQLKKTTDLFKETSNPQKKESPVEEKDIPLDHTGSEEEIIPPRNISPQKINQDEKENSHSIPLMNADAMDEIKNSPSLQNSKNSNNKKETINIIVGATIENSTPNNTKSTSETAASHSKIIHKTNETSEESSKTYVIVTPPPSTNTPSTLSPKSKDSVVISQAEALSSKPAHPNTQELSDIIDQKLKIKWDELLENQVKKELHKVIKETSEPPSPPDTQELSNIIDQKLKIKFDELLENQVKKEFHKVIKETSKPPSPPDTQELSNIIDQKLKIKFDELLENQVKKELHKVIKETSKPPSPPDTQELSNIIDQKLKIKWNELLENQVKKELNQMIDHAVSKVFKEQLKEILTQKGVESIKEISLDIIPEVSKQIVQKEIRKLIRESSKITTSS